MVNGMKIHHCTLNLSLLCVGHQTQIRDPTTNMVKVSVCLNDVTVCNILHH